jgi:hypothetical protein
VEKRNQVVGDTSENKFFQSSVDNHAGDVIKPSIAYHRKRRTKMSDIKGQILNDLHAIDALLSDRTKWTSRTLARNASGNPCAVNDPTAVSWCLLGAALKVCDTRNAFLEVICTLQSPIKGNITPFNDHHDFTAVKAVIAEAIHTAGRQSP